MPGNGKYTTYVPPKSPRRTFLEKLFSGDNNNSPFVGLDQDVASQHANIQGNLYLRAV